MTQKEIKRIAKVIKRTKSEKILETKSETLAYLVGSFEIVFGGFNPKFNKDEFLKECGFEHLI